MRGHIHKRGSTWTVVYDETAGEEGKRRQRSKGGFVTKRDAQRFLTDTLARIGDGSYAAPSKLALGEFLTDEWLPAIEGTVRPSSHATYERLARKHISPHIGSVRLQALSGGHLNGLYRKLEQSGLSVAGDSRRTRRAAPGVARRGAPGPAGAQPGGHGGSARPGTLACPGMDRNGATAVPRPRSRGPAVCAVAVWRNDGHETRRACRGDVALPRPRRRQAGGRAAAAPDAWRGQLRPAQVGSVTSHGGARP
jgi:hypothetical protein